MTITVVSTPSTPPPATATASGSDDAAAQDFANLLHGKLATNAAPSTATIDQPNDVPIPEAAPADAALLLTTLGHAAPPSEAEPADPAPSDAAPVDAASLLAALGLVTTPAPPVPPTTQAATKADSPSAEPLSAVSGTAGQVPISAVPGESLKTEPASVPSALGDDKAAKFAVTSAPQEKAVAAEIAATDTPANGSAALVSNAPTHANAATVKHSSTLAVATPVRDQNWATDFGQKVVWLASNDKQAAQLTLNPPQMGPIEISLNIDKGNATVSFASASAEVRDAIETALPRLREMFASAGIELGQTNVGAQSFSQQQSANGERGQSSSRWVTDNAILAADTTGTLPARAFSAQQGNRMVDIFA